MLIHMLNLLLDGEVAAIFNSAFVVPVAGCLMAAVIVVASIWHSVRTREIRSHERLAMIAQGLIPEPEVDREVMRQGAAPDAVTNGRAISPLSNGAGARRAGLVLCGAGGGLILFFAFLAVVLRERDVFSGAAAGILPAALGVGFLVDARMRKREYEKAVSEGRVLPPSYAASLVGQTPAPPPPPLVPEGMTPAQASDWRPLQERSR